MGFWRREEGQSLVLMALTMVVLVGFLGLATDVGMLYRIRQRVQIAADAAAIAAAVDYLHFTSVSTAQAKGAAAATANGYTDGTSGATVAIHLPPTSGPNQKAGFAEAIVTYPNPTSFMAMFGFPTITVAARGVAGQEIGTNCIYLDATSGTALTLQGAYDIETPGCGVYVNSPDAAAISITGNGGTVNSAFLDVYGTTTPKFQTTPTPISNGAGQQDPPIPLDLTGPTTYNIDVDNSSTWSALNSTGTNPVTTITTANQSLVEPPDTTGQYVVRFENPVVIQDGVILNGSTAGVVYQFEAGVTIPVGATVQFGNGTYDATTGTFGSNTQGAMMDLEGGTLTAQNSNYNLGIYGIVDPKSTGNTFSEYNGIAIFQPSTNPNPLQVQFGSNNEVLDGYIYAPGAALSLHDNGGGVVATGIIAWSMDFQTSSVRIGGYDTANASTTSNKEVLLVE